MNIKKRLRSGVKYLTDTDYRFLVNTSLGFYDKMPDEEYLKRKYKAIMKEDLDLQNPKTFNEKIQWLKIHDRKQHYSDLVDKYAVREVISQRLGEQYLIPLLGVWDKAEDVDFTLLPKQFVLKPTHLSGYVIICRDKDLLNQRAVRDQMRKWLKKEHYLPHREWPYKNIKPRIIAEELIEDQIVDYKFYCFNGEPKMLYISRGLEDHSTAQISFFDMDFHRMPFSRSDFAPYSDQPEKPKNLGQMVNIARQLSREFSFMRLDLYCVNERIYFSEFTFHPCGGYMPFEPKEYDEIVGQMLDLK